MTEEQVHLYDATVKHVSSVGLMDVSVSHGFGLFSLQRVSLVGVSELDLPEDKFDAAKWSLIRFCPGGTKVLLELSTEVAGFNGVWPVIVYRRGVLPDNDGYLVDINRIDYVNVNRYLLWLSGCGFDRDVVKCHSDMVRGKRKHNG